MFRGSKLYFSVLRTEYIPKVKILIIVSSDSNAQIVLLYRVCLPMLP